MITMFCEKVGLGMKILYIGIIKPTVLCDYMNQAASYWFADPRHPNISGLEGAPALLRLCH